MRAYLTALAALFSWSLLACADEDDGDGDTATTAAGEGVGVDEFLEEYFDETACDGFQGCGDELQGRYRFQSFKICSDPSSVGDLENVESQLDGICSSGVNLAVEMDVDLEIEVTGGVCSGGGVVDASMRLDISEQCIREAGGTTLAETCPQLSDALADVPEFSQGGCSVRGNVCSCTGELGVIAEGRCEDFVLESACVMGKTVTFSNAETSGEPAIWTFERVGANASESVRPPELHVSTGASIEPRDLTARIRASLEMAAPRLRAGVRR